MRKLKVINSYTDKELSKNMIIGQEIEVTEERAKVLIDKDFCIDVTEDAETEIIQEELKQEKQRKPRTKKQ